jgi:hypothetical protein
MTADELKSALERKFGQVTVTSNRDEWKAECPFCGGSSLAINVAKRVFHCWKCEESGHLGRLLGRRVPRIEGAGTRRRRTHRGYSPPGEVRSLSSLNRESEAWLYLMNRGFDPKRLDSLFGISYCTSGAPFGGGVFNTTGTLVIPVVENGVDIAWQCRLLYDVDGVSEDMVPYMGWKYDSEKGKYVKPPKYFTMPGFDKGLKLFNYDSAKRFPFVVVTEGAFDAMSVGVCAVAAFGKGLTDEQIALLREWPVIVLLLDPDAEADQERLAERILGTTSRKGGFCLYPNQESKVVQVRLHGYKDAGECPHSELVGQILAAAEKQGISLLDLCKEDPFVSGRSDDDSNE